MPKSVEVIGLDKLQARLNDMRMKLDPNTVASLVELANTCKGFAQIFCPVGTPQSTGIPGYIGGSLKKSIRVKNVLRPTSGKRVIGITSGGYVTNPNTGKIVNYAKFVEFGTSKMIARPFMRPALDLVSRQATRIIKERIKP